MFMHTQNSTKFVSTSTPPPVRRITYTRYMGRAFILSGVIMEERQVEVKRWPGIVVTEYRVKPSNTASNLTVHWVNEADVLAISEVQPVGKCPACGDSGYLGIRNGDNDQPCPICNPVEMDVTF